MGRQSFDGVIGGYRLVFCLVGVFDGFTVSLLFVEEHGDAVVQVYLVFCVLTLYGCFQSLLVVKERGVEVAQSSVADAQRAAHPHHTFFVLDFLCEQYAVLAYGSSFFQLSEVDECRGLLAGKPTASRIGGIHLQSAVDKGNRKFFVAGGIVVYCLKEQGIRLLLVSCFVVGTGGEECQYRQHDE